MTAGPDRRTAPRRAASIHDRQAATEECPPGHRRNESGAALVVKDKDGRIERRDSYGNDPRSTKADARFDVPFQLSKGHR